MTEYLGYDWFGSAVTVVEMGGVIDVDNMEAPLKEIGESAEGLTSKPGKLTAIAHKGEEKYESRAPRLNKRLLK